MNIIVDLPRLFCGFCVALNLVFDIVLSSFFILLFINFHSQSTLSNLAKLFDYNAIIF